MEPEEAPDRAASLSSEMMSTIRDDPESYKELLERLKKDRAAAKQNASGPTQATPPVPQAAPPAPTPVPPPVAPPAATPVTPAAPYNYPPAAPGYTAPNHPVPNYPVPPAKSSTRYVVPGIIAAVILIIILLFAFKVIQL
jgi:hypothetical protein